MTAVMNKAEAGTKVGLGLGSSNGLIVVTKIRDGTLGATTDLRPGMVIRSVNNVNIDGKDSMAVAKLLSEAEGTITVVAEVVEGGIQVAEGDLGGPLGHGLDDALELDADERPHHDLLDPGRIGNDLDEPL